jgi:hypothetical protein
MPIDWRLGYGLGSKPSYFNLEQHYGKVVHTCKRSSDLAKPEGLAISTTFLAFSATRWKGVTKKMVTYHGA